MKLPVLPNLVAILCCVLCASTHDAASHPVQSVIKLLQTLQGKVEQEGKDEEKTYKKFAQWCKDSIGTLGKAVQESKNSIETLIDTVNSKETAKEQLKDKISFLSDEIIKNMGSDASAKKARDDANKAFKAADKDFDTTIKALDEANKALKASKFLQFERPQNFEQEQALVQLIQQPLVLEQLSDDQRDTLTAAVFGGETKPVTEDDILAKEKYAKSGKTYTFKSGNVIELIDGLLVHFQDAKLEATKAETKAANEYAELKDASKDAVDAAKKAKTSKTTLLADVTKDLNTAKSDLKDEQEELKIDTKTLGDTKTTCHIKRSEWLERSDVRHHEIEAMKAAVDILAKVSGVRVAPPKNKKLPTQTASKVVTTKPPLVFLQLEDPKSQVVNLLRQEARSSHSRMFARFAEQLALKVGGPFDEVNSMIRKMIFRLIDEQKKDDEHKHWCDLEFKKSNTSQADHMNKLKSLDAKIKDAKATADTLVIKIKDLDAKVAKLRKFMTDAAEVRKEGQKENKLAIKDAQEAQAAIAKAQAVLTTYYKDSGMITKEPWEFLQAPVPVKLPKEPSSWSSSYTGLTDPSKAGTGAIAVLKATGADFAKMEADTKVQEITDQRQFEKDIKQATIDKAKTQKESDMKNDEKRRTLEKVNSLSRQRKHVAEGLAAEKQYIKDLGPACLDGTHTYAARKKARDSELNALRKGQTQLQDAFKGGPAPAAALVQAVASAPAPASLHMIERHL